MEIIRPYRQQLLSVLWLQQKLTLSGNGDSWLFLGSQLVATHIGNGSFTTTVGEALQVGSNTLTAIYLDPNNLTPSFSYDPSIAAGAPAMPEASTLAMLACGF